MPQRSLREGLPCRAGLSDTYIESAEGEELMREQSMAIPQSPRGLPPAWTAGRRGGRSSALGGNVRRLERSQGRRSPRVKLSWGAGAEGRASSGGLKCPAGRPLSASACTFTSRFALATRPTPSHPPSREASAGPRPHEGRPER